MYIPTAFTEQRLDVLHDLITTHAFAMLITHGPRGFIASHVPTVLLRSRGEFGTLQLHLAKPNPQCDDLAGGAEALAIFQGPHGYISPTWYVSTTTVPTWNYVAVHAYGGTPRVMDDQALREHLDALVAVYESARPNGWSSAKLPGDTFDKLQRVIVGFEIPIVRLEGKWKLGQNRTTEDRAGAIAGLRGTGTSDDAMLAESMEATMR